MREHAVVIAGGGPTGLMLAGELALASVDVAIVERRESQELAGSRAGGLHSRTIEVLDQRGIAERFISQGQAHKVVHFHVPLDISDFPTRHNYVLGLWQNHIERLLAEWVGELKVPIYRGREVMGFSQDAAGVDIELSDGNSLRAEYLVGCDGGRSVIRKTAGIEFPGFDPTVSWLIAEAEMSEEPAFGFRHDAAGSHAIGKLDDAPGRVRLVLTEAQVGPASQPTLRDVSETLVAVYGTDYGIHNPTWISRFTDMTRQAAAYRDRRVLLAGDAAHVHPPVGGQGLNIGVQDAVNLGWKLAQVVKQVSPPSLLDTYHAERHPVAARVLRNTMAQIALRRTDERTKALGGYFSELIRMEEPRKRWAAEISGLDIRYELGRSHAGRSAAGHSSTGHSDTGHSDTGESASSRSEIGQSRTGGSETRVSESAHSDIGNPHPLLGRRMPDLDLSTPDGTQRVFTLLHDARPALLNLGEPGTFDITPWADRVRLVDAKYAGTWELPALGRVTPPTAVLIRPDGYVAWVGNGTPLGLTEELTTWFGSRCRDRRAGQ